MNKVKVEFIKDSSLASDDIQITIKAAKETSTTKRLAAYLTKFGKKERRLLPIKTSNWIVTIKYANLIKVEVQATSLSFFTTDEIIQSAGRLYQVLASLNDDFIQVSRHSIININYLESVEAGFAGSMVAILANNLKTDVSRRYLPALEKELGL